MNRRRIRKIKTCLNCGSLVESRFCPECGQENLEIRPSFHHLISHFLADFFHYDSGFWRTMKTLLLRPGVIVRDYINGKRKTYVEPVKLYIFVSFFTFFVLHFLPDFYEREVEEDVSEMKFSLENHEIGGFNIDENYKNIETEAQFDSIHLSLPDSERMNWFFEKLTRKGLQLKERGEYKGEDLLNTFRESFMNNLPKVLFVYLPIFAFSLWVMHNKKKWFYYDHGVFTLYLFSAILTLIILNSLFSTVISIPLIWFSDLSNIVSFVGGLVSAFLFFYIIYYFFRSHYVVYQERLGISILKCFFLQIINSIIVFLLVLIYTFITFLII